MLIFRHDYGLQFYSILYVVTFYYNLFSDSTITTISLANKNSHIFTVFSFQVPTSIFLNTFYISVIYNSRKQQRTQHIPPLFQILLINYCVFLFYNYRCYIWILQFIWGKPVFFFFSRFSAFSTFTLVPSYSIK